MARRRSRTSRSSRRRRSSSRRGGPRRPSRRRYSRRRLSKSSRSRRSRRSRVPRRTSRRRSARRRRPTKTTIRRSRRPKKRRYRSRATQKAEMRRRQRRGRLIRLARREASNSRSKPRSKYGRFTSPYQKKIIDEMERQKAAWKAKKQTDLAVSRSTKVKGSVKPSKWVPKTYMRGWSTLDDVARKRINSAYDTAASRNLDMRNWDGRPRNSHQIKRGEISPQERHSAKLRSRAIRKELHPRSPSQWAEKTKPKPKKYISPKGPGLGKIVDEVIHNGRIGKAVETLKTPKHALNDKSDVQIYIAVGVAVALGIAAGVGYGVSKR